MNIDLGHRITAWRVVNSCVYEPGFDGFIAVFDGGRRRLPGSRGCVAEVRLSEMVDPNYVVIAKINKKYLPAKPNAK